MYNLYLYSPIISLLMGLKKTELMELCIGDWSSETTLNANEFSSDRSTHEIKGFKSDSSSTQHTQSINMKGDVLIYLPMYFYNHIWKWYANLYYSILGCYTVNGPLYYDRNISECYQRCIHKQQKSFEYFAFKVTCHELFSLFKTITNKVV